MLLLCWCFFHRRGLCLIVFDCAALVMANLQDRKAQAEKFGWDSRYGRMYQQLVEQKKRLRHMLYHCYITSHDEAAGSLMDSALFVSSDGGSM
jgi:hypothetical protein